MVTYHTNLEHDLILKKKLHVSLKLRVACLEFIEKKRFAPSYKEGQDDYMYDR